MQILNDPCFAKIKSKLLAPNIFKVLSLENYEIRHSNFLGWLLSADESHQCGTLFLEKMLEVLFPDYLTSSTASFDVSREKNNIDIALENESTVLIIENKIKSKDHSNQLNSYRIRTEQDQGHKEKHYTYLTLFGEAPLDKDEAIFWKNVSYVDLLACLKDILKRSDKVNRKTKIYIEDYIFALEAYTLEIHEINQTSKDLAKKYHLELYECFKNSLKNIDNKGDLEALKFIKSQTTFARGDGFFRKDDNYYEAFSKSLRQLDFHMPQRGNSTYFVFYPTTFIEYKNNIGQELPFDFTLRFNDKNKTLRFAGNINEGNKNNSAIRQKLINLKDGLSVKFKDNFVKKSGEKTVGVFSKTIAFNPMDYDKSTLLEEIHNFVKKNIERDAKMAAKAILELLEK